jgi:hypothetical protein
VAENKLRFAKTPGKFVSIAEVMLQIATGSPLPGGNEFPTHLSAEAEKNFRARFAIRRQAQNGPKPSLEKAHSVILPIDASPEKPYSYGTVHV